MFYLAMRTYGALRTPLQITRTETAADIAKAYTTGLAVGLTNPFQILWWLTAGLAFMTEIGPAVAAGFFLGILLWTTSFPFFLDLANRRYRGTYRIVIVLSLLLLLAFGVVLVALGLLTAAG
jgi:threonine/homoserine/homoserine lactone efflux protein